MNSRFKLFFTTASILQIVTAVVHSLSFVKSPDPANDTEKQIKALTTNYHMDAGAGFHPTYADFFNSLSASFTLLFLFGGLLNRYVISKKVQPDILKGILNINLVVFGTMFLVTALLTFLPPTLFTGVVFLLLFLARIFYKETA